MSIEQRKERYADLLQVAIVILYTLVLAGGIVRSTGAGLGCPDWPKCFGKFIPPTDISQLPIDYKEKFAIAGKAIADFNTLHTWTEYLNRMLGVVTGIIIIAVTFYSYSYRKERPPIFWASHMALGLVIFNGWLGARVVSTLLNPLVITIHMLAAIATICTLIYCKKKILQVKYKFTAIDATRRKKIQNLSAFLLFAFLIQIILGTQVRENIDILAKNLGETARDIWVSKLSVVFYVHRSYSIILILLVSLQTYWIFNLSQDFLIVKREAYLLICVCFVSIVSGVGLAYLGMPKVLQPLHLLFGILITGTQYSVFSFFGLHPKKEL